MNYQEGEIRVIKKLFPPEEDLENISLKFVPVKIRREEAKKPLFLKRYE